MENRLTVWAAKWRAALTGLLLLLWAAGLVHGAPPVEALLAAAKEGNASELQRLLASGLDVNMRDAEGHSALEFAAAQGKTTCVQLLLDQGATADIRDDDANTPLIPAAQWGHVAIVQLLLNHGADVRAQAANGASALRVAAGHGKLEIVQILLDHGAGIKRTGRDDLDIFDPHDAGAPQVRSLPLEAQPYSQEQELDDAITGATTGGYVDVAKRLLVAKRFAKLISTEGTEVRRCELCQATLRSDVRAVREMLHQDESQSMETLGLALRLAQQEGRTDVAALLRPVAQQKARQVFRQLQVSAELSLPNVTYERVSAALARGADANFGNVLWSAAVTGDRERIEQLLAYGADPNRKGTDDTTPLTAAARNNHPEIVELLLKHGANAADLKEGSGVAWAARTGNPALVDRLLKLGGNPNAVSYYGRTALMEATAAGSIKSVDLLLKAGANINAESKDGYTALMLAENEFHDDVAAALRKAGAIVKPNVAPTPLYGPTLLGETDRVKFLLAHGTDPNRSDRYGGAPLATALERRHYEIANLLLEAGAKPNNGQPDAADYSGLSSLYLLVSSGDDSPASLALLNRLLAAGLDVNAPHGFHRQTPLMAAAEGNKTTFLRALLHAGARTDPQDQEGHTALGLAVNAGHLGTVAILKQARAKQ